MAVLGEFVKITGVPIYFVKDCLTKKFLPEKMQQMIFVKLFICFGYYSSKSEGIF